MLLKRGPEGSLKSLSEELVSYSQNQPKRRLLMMTGLSLASAPKIYLTLRYVLGILPGSDVCYVLKLI